MEVQLQIKWTARRYCFAHSSFLIPMGLKKLVDIACHFQASNRQHIFYKYLMQDLMQLIIISTIQFYPKRHPQQLPSLLHRAIPETPTRKSLWSNVKYCARHLSSTLWRLACFCPISTSFTSASHKVTHVHCKNSSRLNLLKQKCLTNASLFRT